MRLAADAWRRFFDSYEREAFRLETLPSYGVASEAAYNENMHVTIARPDLSPPMPPATSKS